MNESKKRDPRFWNIWAASGAVAPRFSLNAMRDNHGLRMQCAMMLDEFPTAVTTAIEGARDSLEGIVEIIAAQPTSMIDGFFTRTRGRKTQVKTISAFIYSFLAYRRTVDK
jgi:enoyl-[acyl-carrier-protein] reductase (NADH)